MQSKYIADLKLYMTETESIKKSSYKYTIDSKA